jgi:RNA polymerase sigma-70 factor, ECF subfamily
VRDHHGLFPTISGREPEKGYKGSCREVLKAALSRDGKPESPDFPGTWEPHISRGLNARVTAPTPSLKGPDDAALVRQAQAGELDAFEKLVSRHERLVYTIARRITGHDQDAEDVTQQAFLGALEGLGTFRGEAGFGTWLRRIATHAALKILRKRRGFPTVSLDAAIEPQEGYDTVPHPEYIADWRETPEQLIQRRETGRMIDDALSRLDEKHRLVFLLRDVEGLSVKETAAALGLSEANVKVRLLRARLQLREQLTASFGDPSKRLEPHRHDD